MKKKISGGSIILSKYKDTSILACAGMAANYPLCSLNL